MKELTNTPVFGVDHPAMIARKERILAEKHRGRAAFAVLVSISRRTILEIAWQKPVVRQISRRCLFGRG